MLFSVAITLCKRINECAVSFNQTNCGKINSAKPKLVHEWDEYVNMFQVFSETAYFTRTSHIHTQHTHICSKNSLKFQLIIFWMIKWKIVCIFFVGYCCCMWVCILFQLQRITLCISSLQFNFTFHDLVSDCQYEYFSHQLNGDENEKQQEKHIQELSMRYETNSCCELKTRQYSVL